MEFEVEKKFKCPYCFEKISMLLDLSEGGTHSYIEDCEVCCQPIQVTFDVQNHRIGSLSAEAIQ